MTKKLLIAAAGTGGHIYPALAVADYLHRQGWQVSWIGAGSALEKKVVADAYTLNTIPIKGVRNSGLLRKVMMPLNVLRATWRARKLIKRFDPSVVLVMGGYVSVPVGFAARQLKKPFIIHEQNSVLGSSNALLANIATARFAAFDNVFNVKSNAQVIGNPLRQAFYKISAQRKISLPLNVLVFGGSQGARAINQNFSQALLQLPQDQVACWHQTGELDFSTTQSFYQQHHLKVKVQPFIADMASAIDWADIVVARAGALTVSELAAAGRASVLIPLPRAVDNHQFYNARYLEQLGASKIMLQATLTPTLLAAQLQAYIDNPAELEAMAKAAKQLYAGNATQKLAQACEKYSD